MKYGARNQLQATVEKIKTGDVMCQVTLKVKSDSRMNSVMTVESLNDLNLSEGETVKVVVKAINVLLVRE